MTEYTGWDDYMKEKTKKTNHPYSCGFHAALEAGVITEYSNPYGTGYRLQGDSSSLYIDYCPFCGRETSS